MSLPTTTSRFIFHFVCKQKIKFSVFIFTSIIWAVNDALFPYFIKHMVNILENYQGDPNDVYMSLSGILLALVIVWIFTELLLSIQGIVQIYTYPYFRANIRSAVFNYVKSHSHEYFSSQFAGNIGKKITDLPTSCQTVMKTICFDFVTAGTGVVIVAFMMWSINPIFSYILLIWLCAHLGITFVFLRYGYVLWEQHAESVSVLSGNIMDVFSNIFTVRLFARDKYEEKYIQQAQQYEIKKSKKAMWLLELSRIGMEFSGLFLIFSMVFMLVRGWIQGWVTLGDFTQISMQSFWLLGWIWYISSQLNVFIREYGAISNALRIIKKNHDVIDNKHASPIFITQGKICFEDVSFGYKKNRSIFSNLNITIEPGQKVGLVGASGSGKSTFVNLILRCYDLSAGKILIDEQNIAHVSQNSLCQQIAMLPQDPTLFHRSLMENIRYGCLDATDEMVIKASTLAHCHEFIEKLDYGYDELVGERGIKLSGGQRQRIAIARAILKNSPILILDEATSSLDSVTEKTIQESLNYLMQGKTTLVIAHRLSTLTHMDRILVFHNGVIIEDNRKELLLKEPGHFANLWNIQKDEFFRL